MALTGGACLAAGLALILGLLLVAGRPVAFLRDAFAQTIASFVLISLLLFLARGSGFPFLPLYLLAALGLMRVGGTGRAAIATAVAAGGYLAALAYRGAPDWYAIGLDVAFITLFCAIAWGLGARLRRLRAHDSELSSALASERRRAERAESLAHRFGPILGLSDLDGILRWTLEAARAIVGGTYAHVARPDGTHHRTLAEGDADAYPSWWHPAIQRLVLWSCRENRIVRSEEAVGGIQSFVAVPVGAAGGERWGAIVLGGEGFDDADERTLGLLAAAVAPALQGADDAPAGRDPVTGLPNRASLHRVLGGRLSESRALTLLVAGLDGFRDYHGARGPDAADELLRRVGVRLGESYRLVFRSGEDEFAVVHGGAGGPKAREAARAIRRLASEAAAESGNAPGVSVGFVAVEPGEEADAYGLLDAATRALAEARERSDGVAEYEAGASTGGAPAPEGLGRGSEAAAKVFLTLAEAAEFRGPHIGEHSRAVARVARRIWSQLALPPEQLRALEVGALLHDLGKIGIPDYVLLRSGRLTEEEHEVMKRHPILGARMLAPIKELAPALPALLHHHEKFDGGGYPDGLTGEEIPLMARIVSVADAFDALVRDRPGLGGVPQREAIKEIERGAGSRFDPGVVRAFLEAMGEPEERRTGSAG